ncbi:hypothetical protein [Cryptosporangium aurantiacum]|uniref:Uncharacterized protein n=1 Tax=Cryptosporangium aurantiacum TaxID=134849 RepID=A0A1M7PBA2_9ACTN|nr:hypothetical protein [Cryptosporangium aurantiacum]SHN14131.1 hypothetical protein SAMN05443668_103156 [Cryptosporangium aurantiacum]
MADYTVQIETSDYDYDWRVVSRWAHVTDDRTPADLGEWVVQTNWIADGADWRVRIWPGHDADPESKPVYDAGWNDYEP